MPNPNYGVALWCLLAAAVPAGAAIVTTSQSFSGTSGSLDFPKFDPSLGTLDRVGLEFGDTTAGASMTVQNNNPFGGGSSVSLSATITFTEPLSGDSLSQSLSGGGGGGAGPNSSSSASGTLMGFGFPTTGPSSPTYYSDPTILAAWQGAGTGSLDWGVGPLSFSGAASGFDFSGSITSATGTFYLHFDYTPVPEPETWAGLWAAGLMGFAFVRAVRSRRPVG